jgi:arylsulfatase A-like enzyme
VPPSGKELHGKSLGPIPRNPQATARDTALSLNTRKPGGAMRKATWHYMNYSGKGEELYDMAKDPHQYKNLVRNPAYAKLLKNARARTSQTARERLMRERMQKQLMIAATTVALALFGVCTVARAAPRPDVAKATSGKPNIVHILTDDLGWQDMAAYYRAVHGKEAIYETPNMDRIAQNGIRFMQAYSPSATCAPSRAAYMAGQYTPHTGVLHVNGSMPPTPFQSRFQYIDGFYPMRLDLGTPTIARELQKAGYLTGHIKKWHIGGRSSGYPGPMQYGFDFSWAAGSKDYNDPDVWDPNRKHKQQYWNGIWLPLRPRHQGFATSAPDDPFRTDPSDDDRPLDGVTDLAVRWLDKAKDQNKPFFLNLCPSLVHGPISTRDRKRLEHYCKKMGVPFPTDPEKITDKRWGQVNPYYAAMIDGLDWGVGKVLTFLERTDDPRNPGHKLIDNTYLIVSSDNGGAEGNFASRERVADNSPLREGKSTVYEGGIRVPVIIQGPGITAGSANDTPINLIDMFPTFMAMAGAKPAADLELDGCNILPIIKGEQEEARFPDGTVRDTLFFTLPVGDCSASAVRKGGWKLVLNHAPEHANKPPIELFRMYNDDGSVNDPGESRNLADTHPEKRDELLADLNAWFDTFDAQLPYKNPKPVPAERALPGADKVPAVTKRSSTANQVLVQFETGADKSNVVKGILVYTTNGSDLLRDNPSYEEWFSVPATVGNGIATATAPPGMTHGIFCLRDENGFLVKSKETPPYVGPGGDRRFTIAKTPKDTYAWRPGLISLINAAKSAEQAATKTGQSTGALAAAIQIAESVVKTPVDEKSYAPAMRNLRHEIRALDVPEAKLSVLNLFVTEKWSSRDRQDVTARITARGENAPRETAARAFDGKIKTKWLDFSPTGSWIQHDHGVLTAISAYTITSAKDAPPRDPKDWELLGSNDGKTWTALDSRAGEVWSKRNEKRSFTVKDKTPYRMFRLSITAVRDREAANSVQIAEIEFLHCQVQ